MTFVAALLHVAFAAVILLAGCADDGQRESVAERRRDPPPFTEVSEPSTEVSEEIREIDCSDRITSEDRARVEEPFALESGHVPERQEQFQRVRAWAEGLYPSSFAGGWLIDHPKGKRMALAFTECAEERAALAAAEVSVRRNLVHAKVVPRSLAQLQAIHDRALNHFDELQEFGVYAISTDEPTNTLKVYSEAPLPERARTAIQRILQSTALTFEVAEQARAGGDALSQEGGADG